MKCPVDDETLHMTERNGVEIDFCPKCRGVWLDRGELDKILDRAAEEGVPSQTSRSGYRDSDDRDRRYRDESGSFRKKRRKESFLGELFDF